MAVNNLTFSILAQNLST